MKSVLIATGLSLGVASVASADILSDEATALLLYPRVVNGPIFDGRDAESIIQITNTSTNPQLVHCFYVDASSRCSISERSCDALENSCAPEEGFCIPGWVETDFDIMLTPRQPLAWRVSNGLQGDDLPLTGAIVGPGNSTNVGTSIPPVGLPFLGELKCIAVDGSRLPVPNNVLIGNATTVVQDDDPSAFQLGLFTIDKSNAIGIKAIDGDANGDKILVLGGGENEYNGCPQVLIVDHLFDFAFLENTGEFRSRLTLVPCTEDLNLNVPGSTTAQYLVFNEFEQRFSTSAPVDCYFERYLSQIDTRDPTRSIFSVFVSGTIAGQTRIRGVQHGLLGLLTAYTEPGSSAAMNIHFQGDRPDADTWTIP
jgi:hypothetical protein